MNAAGKPPQQRPPRREEKYPLWAVYYREASGGPGFALWAAYRERPDAENACTFLRNAGKVPLLVGGLAFHVPL
jgi:hypothetical protein